MGASKIRAGDLVSLLRIGLALVFLVAFRRQYTGLFLVSVAAAVAAQITDHLDGYLIRRYSAPTLTGWVMDSFADRAFYIAALLAFEREYHLNEVLVWAFVLREMCLYAVRVVVGDFQPILGSFRALSLVHAAIVRSAIALGCAIPFGIFPTIATNSLISCLGPIVGVATLAGFLNLFALLRNLR